jgi:superfamily II DNA or RNA helicase/very-short-patch-repair endonuclease
MRPASGLVDHQSTPEIKIALFRSLFRGRDDVYPRRFESRRTGKSGYQPACGNEWVRGVCEKPRIKCSACPHQQFLPITDEVIRWHLSGYDRAGEMFVMGVYPMLRDETCYFLVVDLDQADWQEDARALLDTCRRLEVPAYLERSRSGQGGHIWLFFQQALPAALTRRLGAYLLTETMERHPDIGLASYDRFFPNQDTLPQGGLGNLIALPLQKQARQQGNSLFLDETFQPYGDQWRFLACVERIDQTSVEERVTEAERRGRVVGVRIPNIDDEEGGPWATPGSRRREPILVDKLPEQIELILGNQIYIAKDDLTPGLCNRLVRLAAFQNPEFYRAQAMRLPTYGKPRVIGCAEDHRQHMGLPRGCLDDVRGLLAELGIRSEVRDERFFGEPLCVKFQGVLRAEQQAAARAMLSHDTGVLSATTAFGKTVIAAWLIAQRAVNTLILVHRRQLLEQWVDRLSSFLGISPRDIGRVGGGRRKPTGRLDVALIQSLSRQGNIDDMVGDYGQILVDECHHLSAQSFEQVVRQARARFVTGLSATVTRKDGHHPIVLMQCGPVRYRVDAKVQAAKRPFEHTVFVRPTNFCPSRLNSEDKRIQFQDLCTQLIADSARNQLICADVSHAIHEGRFPLILTERNEHLDLLAEPLLQGDYELIVLRGGMGRRRVREIMDRLIQSPDPPPRVILATGRYVGEGFDNARLDTLFLTMPISWRGTIAQYAGRLHRLHDCKREVRVYDYADLNVSMLARMFDRRCRGYEAVGYDVSLPASAVPGWPAEVPLPIDSGWKSDYAITVRRLVQDGVDMPLAQLFVDAANQKAIDNCPEGEGVLRARSATEAFLYRRLQTLPETAGKFRLNSELPIPFDGQGAMEVDLLSTAHKLVIELDGPQHLASVEAYRRDRRKDLLLQEQGYFVLRFLAEDVGKQLDSVLDSIVHSVTCLENRCR